MYISGWNHKSHNNKWRIQNNESRSQIYHSVFLSIIFMSGIYNKLMNIYIFGNFSDLKEKIKKD